MHPSHRHYIRNARDAAYAHSRMLTYADVCSQRQYIRNARDTAAEHWRARFDCRQKAKKSVLAFLNNCRFS
jgi:hypothetical protein